MSSGRLSGFNGCQYLGAAAHTSKQIDVIVIQEDTVISVLSGVDSNGATVNYLTSIGLSGITLKQGAILTTPYGGTFTTITVDSGSAIGYLKA